MAHTQDDYVRAYRQVSPDTTLTDDQILDLLRQGASQTGDAAAHQGLFDQLPEAPHFDNPKKEASPDGLGAQLWDETKKGVARGVDTMQAHLYSTEGLAGDLIGSETLKKQGFEGYQRNMAEARQNSGAVESIKNINTFQDAVKWAVGSLAENIPAFAGTAVAGAAAAALAPEAAVAGGAGLLLKGAQSLGLGLTEKMAADAGIKYVAGKLSQKAVASFLASQAFQFTQTQNYGELVERGGENVVPLAVFDGLVNSAFGAIGPQRLIKGFSSEQAAQNFVKGALLKIAPGGIVNAALQQAAVDAATNAASSGLKEAGVNMLTGLVQEAVNLGTESISNRDNPDKVPSTDEWKLRLAQAGLNGMLVGGTMGTIHSAVGRLIEGKAPNASAAVDEAAGTQAKAPFTFVQDTPPTARAVGDVWWDSSNGNAKHQWDGKSWVPVAGVAPSTSGSFPEPKSMAIPAPDMAAAAPDRNFPALPVAPAEPAAVAPTEAPSAPAPAPAVEAPHANVAAVAAAGERVSEAARATEVAGTPSRLSPEDIRAKANAVRSGEEVLDRVPNIGKPKDVLPEAPAPVEPRAPAPVDTPAPVPPAAPVTPETPAPVVPAPEVPVARGPEVAPAPEPARPAAAHIEGSGYLLGSREIDSGYNHWTRDHGVDLPSKGEESTRMLVFERNGEKVMAPLVKRSNEVYVYAPGELQRKGAKGPVPIFEKVRDFVKTESGRTPLAIVDVSEPTGGVVSFSGDLPTTTAPEITRRLAGAAKQSVATSIEVSQARLKRGRAEAVRETREKVAATAPEARAAAPKGKEPTQILAEVAQKGAAIAEALPPKVAKVLPTAASLEQVLADRVMSLPSSERKLARAGAKNGLLQVLTADTDTLIRRASGLLRNSEFPKVISEVTDIAQREQVGEALRNVIREMYPEDAANIEGTDTIAGPEVHESEMSKPKDTATSDEASRVAPRGDSRRASDEDYSSTMRSVVGSARELGIDISATDVAKSLGGKYTKNSRSIFLAVSNLIEPSRQDVVTALHEVIHDAVENLPAAFRHALHEAVETLSDDALFDGVGPVDPRLRDGSLPEGQALGQRTNERLVEHLAHYGVNAGEARGMLNQLWRAVRSLYYQAAMHLQKAFFGEEGVSKEMAFDYAHTLVEQIRNGDFESLASFTIPFGKPRTLGHIEQIVTNGRTTEITPLVHPRTGEYLPRVSSDESFLGAFHDVHSPIDRGLEKVSQSGDIDTAAAASELERISAENPNIGLRISPESDPRKGIADQIRAGHDLALRNLIRRTAVVNAIHSHIQKLYNAVKAAAPELSPEEQLAARRSGKGVYTIDSIEQFYRELGLADPRRGHEALVEQTATRFKDAGLSDNFVTKFKPDVQIDDLKSDTGLWLEANTQAHEMLRRRESAVRGKYARIESELQRLGQREQERRVKIVELGNNLADASKLQDLVSTEVVDYVERLKREFQTYKNGNAASDTQRAERQAGFHLGILSAVQDLVEFDPTAPEGTRAKSDVLRQAFDKLMTKGIDRWAPQREPIGQWVRKLYELEADGINLEKAPVGEILKALHARNSATPDVTEMVKVFSSNPDERAEARLRLAGVLAVVKSEKHLTDTLAARLDKSAESADHLNNLAKFLRANSEIERQGVLDTLKKNAKYNSVERIIRWSKGLAKLQEVQDRQAQLLRLKAVYPGALKILTELRARAETNAFIHAYAPIVFGSKIYAPARPDVDSEAFLSKVQGDDTRNPHIAHLEPLEGRDAQVVEIRRLRNLQDAWLDHQQKTGKDVGFAYNTVLRQNRELHEKLFFTDTGYDTVAGFLHTRLSGFAQILQSSGTKEGEMCARLSAQHTEIVRALTPRFVQRGKSLERMIAPLYKRLNVTWEDLAPYVNRFMNYAQSGAFFDPESAFIHMRKVWATEGDPLAAKLVQKENWAVFRDWVDGMRNTMQELILPEKNRYAYGVRDEKLRVVVGYDRKSEPVLGPGYRREIPKGDILTLPQTASTELRSTLNSMRKSLRGANEADTISVLLKALSTGEGRAVLVEPLLTDWVALNLPEPTHSDGISRHVDINVSRDAYLKANGDIVKYAENLHDYFSERHGDAIKEDVHTYTEHVSDWLIRKLRSVDTTLDPDTQNFGSFFTTKHFILDARDGELWPPAWTQYMVLTDKTMGALAHNIAMNGAFGTDLSSAKALISQMATRLQDLSKQWEKLSKDDLAKRPAVERERMEQARKYLAEVSGSNGGRLISQLHAILNPESTGQADKGLIRTAWATSIGLMTTGFKGGLYNIANPINRILDHGLSLDTARQMFGDYSNIAVGLGAAHLNAVLGILNIDPVAADRPYYDAIRDAVGFSNGMYDTKTLLAGEYGMSTKSMSDRNRRRLEVVSRLVGQGKVNLHDASKGNVLLWNPFQTFQNLGNLAYLTTELKTFERMVSAGAKFYSKNPEKMTEGHSLAAADLGLSRAYFEAYQRKYRLYGLDVEARAQEAAKTGKPVKLGVEEIRKLNALMTEEVSGEGTLNTRPTWTQSSAFGRDMSTFVGFRAWQTQKFLNLLKSDTGRLTLKSLAAATATLALGVAPASYAFSMLLDAYDQYGQKKKSNVLSVDLKNQSAGQNALALLDRIQNVGTTGIAGDIVNSILNAKDGSGATNALSIDNRIVMVNQLQSLVKFFQSLAASGTDATYASTLRPALSALGFNGLQQNLNLVNNLIPGFDELPLVGAAAQAEAGINSRTNAGNWLRVGLRANNMETRSMGGSGTPNRATPHITDMVLAAYRNDPKMFKDAVNAAVQAEIAMGRTDPYEAVRQAYASRNLLKSIPRSPLTTAEVGQLLRSMPPAGATAIREAVEAHNRFGAMIGVTPYYGATDVSEKTAAIHAARAAGLGDSVEDLRAKLAAQRDGSPD